MTKNKLTDLNDHLFAQIERLSNEDMTEDNLKSEIARAQAIAGVADRITENARLRIDAAKVFAQHGADVLPMLPQIGGKGGAT